MANSTLTADVIAKAAVGILDNELVMANKVFRGYESEFSNSVNGYEIGDTITIRRPTDFTVRSGATMDTQDVVEGSTSLTVNTQKGVDFRFTSQQLTLDIKELSERVIKPAMIQLANEIDADLHSLYKDVPNWVGEPGQLINSFSDFYKGRERLNEFGVPQDMVYATLSPADHAAMLGSQTSLYINEPANSAYRKGLLGNIGGVDTYMSQNVPTHTVGTWAGSTIAVDGAVTAATISYDDVKTTNTQTITFDGFTASAPAVSVGDSFTIADVYAVNPVTKERLSFLKEFTVVSTANATGNQVDVTFSPAMIWSGAQQTISTSASDLDGKEITPTGTDATGYRQNMMFHRDAFSLVMVPMVAPPGAVDVGRKSFKGTSVRVIPGYDQTNDISSWRLDVLYGKKTVDPRKAVRLSGTS